MTQEVHQSTIVIAKPLEYVFRFTTEPIKFPMWTGATSVALVGADPVDRIGAKYNVVFSSLFSKSVSTIEVVGYKPYTQWEFHAEKPRGIFRYEFQEQGSEQTMVTLTFISDNVSGVVTDAGIVRNLERLLFNLKKHLEKGQHV